MRSSTPTKRSFWNSAIRWYALVVVWGVAWSLSAIGFSRYADGLGQTWTWTEIAYRTLQLVVLESGSLEGHLDITLETARFLLPALTGVTALQAVSVFFHRQLSDLRLRAIKDHLVVIGLNKKSLRLLHNARSRGFRCVVVAESPDPAMAEAVRAMGADLIKADPRDEVVLAMARVEHASHVVCLLQQDTDNLRVAMAIRPNGSKPRRVVELRSSELVDLLKGLALKPISGSMARLETYNEYLLTAGSLIDLDPDWASRTPPTRVQIFGAGELGGRLAEKVLYTWRVANNGRTSLTLIDLDPQPVIKDLNQRHPELALFCNLEGVSADLTSRAEVDPILLSPANPPHKVYICLTDPILNLRLLLSMAANSRYANAKIFARVDERDAELTRAMTATVNTAMASNIVPFDPASAWLTVDVVLGGVSEALARGLYHTYRKAAHASHDQDAWEKLSEEEKGANRTLAARTLANIEDLGFTPLPMRGWEAINFRFAESEIEAMAIAEHNAWRAEKISAGWRFGNLTDSQLKTHADLVGWDQLPETEKAKNTQFFLDLPKLLADLGYALEKIA